MLLRRVTEHVRDQNWFAVFIDFIIVVVGVFIGIQVANWNDARSLDKLEKELLIELRHEISADIRKAENLVDHFNNVHAAGKRSIAFMDSDRDCGDACWPVLADFFHASHWFSVAIQQSVFDEMRRQGLPQSREIVALVENYHAHNNVTARILADLPDYRKVVRSLYPSRFTKPIGPLVGASKRAWKLLNTTLAHPPCPMILPRRLSPQLCSIPMCDPPSRFGSAK